MDYIKNIDTTTGLGAIDYDIQACIEEFCETEGIADLRTVPQTVWTYCMTYIGMRLFKKKNGFFKDTTYKKGSAMPTTYNAYDLAKIEAGTDCYIALCRKYDKIVTLAGLCEFLGVGRMYFSKRGDMAWKNRIREKIYMASEDTATEALVGGKRSPMSILPYLNHFHGWAHDASSRVEGDGNAVASLPDLSGYLEKKE